MKKKSLVILIIMLLIMGNLSAGVNEIVQLPDPQRTGGMPLFEALDSRQSARSYSPQKLTMQQLSNLLWAAYGVNRDDGRRTAPSARNVQEFDIYLIMEDGWYIYDHTDHALIRLGDEDLREHAGSQDFVPTAPLNLIFVADYDRMTGYSPENSDFYSATDVGFISQNVYLFCASEGMATVVRGLVDRDLLRKVLNLKPSQHVILGQTVGFPGN